MTVEPRVSLAPAVSPGRRSPYRRLLRRPAGLVGLGIVTLLLVVAVFAPWVAPYDGSAQAIENRLQGPSPAHLLGTDALGRDLLSRIILGVRVELAVAIPAVCAAVFLGLVLGLVAGYLGGWVDNAVVVVLDTLQAFPSVVLALVLVAVLGPSMSNLVVVVAITFAPQSARVCRASVLALRQDPFIEAERALGAGSLRVIVVHILPNVVAPLFILLAMNIPSAITVEAGLSFLGMGAQPPTPSWGVILSEGFESVYEAPWAVLWTGLALVVTTIGFTMLGETLRDASDPRLAGAKRVRYAR